MIPSAKPITAQLPPHMTPFLRPRQSSRPSRRATTTTTCSLGASFVILVIAVALFNTLVGGWWWHRTQKAVILSSSSIDEETRTATTTYDHVNIQQPTIIMRNDEQQPVSVKLAEMLDESRRKCKDVKTTRNTAFIGSFYELQSSSPTTCFIGVTTGVVMAAPKTYRDQSRLRLPYYTSGDATVFYRCNSVASFFRAHSDVNPKLVEEAAKKCFQSRGDDSALRQIALSSSTPDIISMLQTWLTDSGALEACQRAHRLHSSHESTRRHLLLQSNLWLPHLPSDAMQRAVGDVNTHDVIPPLRTQFVGYTENAVIDRSGRIEAFDSVGLVAVLYPYRGAYSHRHLCEETASPVGKNMKFVPDQPCRVRAAEKKTPSCLTVARTLEVNGNFSLATSCGNGLVVARVFVLSQVYAEQMFHYLTEDLPRIGAHLDWLQRDETFFIHASCSRIAGVCTSMLELLGIHSSRVLDSGVPVFAARVVMPEGGRRHWPLSQVWGFETIRQHALQAINMSSVQDDEPCFSPTRPVRVLVLRRSNTKLNPFHVDWYDTLGDMLIRDPAFNYGLGKSIEVRMHADADRTVMSSARLQILNFLWADVVLGAHGAGLSLTMFCRRCTHVVSLRGRINSDVYEHLALAMGLGFHHGFFSYTFRHTYVDFQNGLATAIVSSVRAALAPIRIACVVSSLSDDVFQSGVDVFLGTCSSVVHKVRKITTKRDDMCAEAAEQMMGVVGKNGDMTHVAWIDAVNVTGVGDLSLWALDLQRFQGIAFVHKTRLGAMVMQINDDLTTTSATAFCTDPITMSRTYSGYSVSFTVGDRMANGYWNTQGPIGGAFVTPTWDDMTMLNKLVEVPFRVYEEGGSGNHWWNDAAHHALGYNEDVEAIEKHQWLFSMFSENIGVNGERKVYWKPFPVRDAARRDDPTAQSWGAPGKWISVAVAILFDGTANDAW